MENETAVESPSENRFWWLFLSLCLLFLIYLGREDYWWAFHRVDLWRRKRCRDFLTRCPPFGAVSLLSSLPPSLRSVSLPPSPAILTLWELQSLTGGKFFPRRYAFVPIAFIPISLLRARLQLHRVSFVNVTKFMTSRCDRPSLMRIGFRMLTTEFDLSLSLSLSLSFSFSFSFSLSFSLSLFLSVCLSIHPSIYLSIYLSFYLYQE